jgi:uncharacterized protein DUF4396
MIPSWLHILSVVALAAGFLCAGIVLLDVLRSPQRMAIMNVVWPITALFGTVVIVWLYFRYGKLATRQAVRSAEHAGQKPPAPRETPFPAIVAKGAFHCGSGCCIGDICAEWLAFAFPAIALWLGWQQFFQEKMFAVWILDFVFAFVLGIAFQYFTIVPMRQLGKLEGIWQAIKADTFSLTAWQVGMYGFMAIAAFWLFRGVLGVRLEVNTAEFWFMMQIAMICGFATSYPVNWWLIKAGIKEKM